MKNTAKLSLLLLLGVAQQSLEAKPEVAKKMAASTPKNVEMEKKRVIHRAIVKAQQNGDIAGLPQIALEWSSLKPVKNVTEEQLRKAKAAYDVQEDSVLELCKERNQYLIKHYPVYSERQNLIDALDKFCSDPKNSEKLMMAYQDDMNLNEINAAEYKVQSYFWTYQQLQNQYDKEHPQFYGPNHRPYMPMTGLTPAEMQIQAKKAVQITLAPGTKLSPDKPNGLPTLSPSGSINPMINTQGTKYTLTFPDGTAVTDTTAQLNYITTKIPHPAGFVGGSDQSTAYTLIIPKHAKPVLFYVLEHRVNGDIVVYATVTIMKKKDAAMPAQDQKEKSTKTASPTSKKTEKVVPKEIMPPIVVPVMSKHHKAGQKDEDSRPVDLVPVKRSRPEPATIVKPKHHKAGQKDSDTNN